MLLFKSYLTRSFLSVTHCDDRYAWRRFALASGDTFNVARSHQIGPVGPTRPLWSLSRAGKPVCFMSILQFVNTELGGRQGHNWDGCRGLFLSVSVLRSSGTPEAPLLVELWAQGELLIYPQLVNRAIFTAALVLVPTPVFWYYLHAGPLVVIERPVISSNADSLACFRRGGQRAHTKAVTMMTSALPTSRTSAPTQISPREKPPCSRSGWSDRSCICSKVGPKKKKNGSATAVEIHLDLPALISSKAVETF